MHSPPARQERKPATPRKVKATRALTRFATSPPKVTPELVRTVAAQVEQHGRVLAVLAGEIAGDRPLFQAARRSVRVRLQALRQDAADLLAALDGTGASA